VEYHFITWDGTDATEEVSTGLTEIYAHFVGVAHGANAGHTEEDLGFLEIDETADANGVITVSSGAITVNRIASSADGTLGDQQTMLVLIGQS
jgi:hypothetical protein